MGLFKRIFQILAFTVGLFALGVLAGLAGVTRWN